MRQTALLSLLPLSLLLAPSAASADPERLNNPAPAPVAPAPPPTRYDAPPPVAGYNPPPPVTGYTPPPVVQARPQRAMMAPQPAYMPQPAQPVQPPPARQGLFVGVQGGAAIPLTGEYSSLTGTGFMGLGHIGWATPSGISFRAEIGVRSNAFTPIDLLGTSLTSVFYGAGLRWTSPRGTLRPYGEVLVDAFSTIASDATTATSSSTGTGVSVGAAVGAEIELSSALSLELAVRYDHIVVRGGNEALTGGLLGALGGGTFYF